MKRVETFVAAVLSCLGTPFHVNGRSCGRGIDCAGVVDHALNVCRIPHQDFAYSLGQNRYGLLRDGLASAFTETEGEMHPGDVAAYHCPKVTPGHCAVFVGSVMAKQLKAAAMYTGEIRDMPGPFIVDCSTGGFVALTLPPSGWKERIVKMGGEFSQWRLKDGR